MRVLFINSVCGIRSTGRICVAQARALEAQGHTCRIAYGRVEAIPDSCRKYALRIGTGLDLKLHALRTRLLDGHGFGSKRATRAFLREADAFDPDLLWLHNLHGYYINVEMLFDWIKRRPNMRVRWTLHDCWAFTGHCPQFTMAGCEGWRTGCARCPQAREYPATFGLSRAASNFRRKRRAFQGVRDMTLITPSEWLAGLVRQSFLAEYPVEVCPNAIDETVFRPTPSDFRQRHGLDDRVIVLGVSSMWEPRKGLPDFVRLNDLLDDRFALVLVGLTDAQRARMPASFVCLPRTGSPQELAAIYSAADVFFNPSYEDTLPTVNLEAQACGAPVVAYDAGGARETARGDRCAFVPAGDVEAAARAIRARVDGR